MRKGPELAARARVYIRKIRSEKDDAAFVGDDIAVRCNLVCVAAVLLRMLCACSRWPSCRKKPIRTRRSPLLGGYSILAPGEQGSDAGQEEQAALQ